MTLRPPSLTTVVKRARPKLHTCFFFVAPLPVTSRCNFLPSVSPLNHHPPHRPLHAFPFPLPQTPVHCPARQPQPIRPRTIPTTPTASASIPSRPNLSNVSESVLRAVETLSRQPRQTVSDIAATAGLPLSQAADEAVLLASLVSAPIDVTDSGDIAYRFPSNVRAILRTRSLRAQISMAWRKASPALFLIARVAFGALLVVSIVVTFLAIAALSSASKSDDDRRNQSPVFAPRLFAPDIFDVMFYTQRYPPRQRREGEMSFFEAVYSFVFGDADPNQDFDDRRWRTVGAVIRANRGAVTAEQLAPYLDLSTTTSDANVVDESYVLPALTRFQGHPEVTESGDIIYVFPDFMKTGRRAALGAGRTEMVGTRSTAPLLESEIPLTRAPPGQRALVIALGMVNVAGVLVLGSKLLTVVPVTADAVALLAGVRALYGPLFAYAASFVVLPFVRWFRLRSVNREIRERNRARESAAMAVRGMNAELRRKMLAAERFVVEGAQVSDSDVVYSSDRDIIDQNTVQDDLTDDFDRRLKG